MYNNNNGLKLVIAISAIYRRFWPGYKRPFKNVPFSHILWPLFLKAPIWERITPSATSRVVGMALLAIALSPLLPSVAGAETLSLEQLIAKTQDTYEKTADLRAHFTQEVTIRSMKKTEKEEGTVTFKNPRMMLWDYAKPKAKKLVINSQKAWLYVPEDRMVYVQNADDVYRSRMAVKFLSGLGKLSEDFQVRFTKDPPIDDEGNYLLTLTAKETGAGIDKLYLTIDGKSFQIIQSRFNDALGNTTRLRFSDMRVNTGVSEKFFTFKTPEGVEEVRMPQ